MSGRSWWAREKWRIIRTVAMAVAAMPIALEVLHDELLAYVTAWSVAIVIDGLVHHFSLWRRKRRSRRRVP